MASCSQFCTAQQQPLLLPLLQEGLDAHLAGFVAAAPRALNGFVEALHAYVACDLEEVNALKLTPVKHYRTPRTGDTEFKLELYRNFTSFEH